MTTNRRSHPRRPLDLKIRVDGPKGRQLLVARDLSIAGLFVETSTVFRVGQLVECRIELPDGPSARRLELTAEVRHLSNGYHTEDGEGPYRGIGLRFVRMEADVQNHLDGFLARGASG